jgi:hypothetical protein
MVRRLDVRLRGGTSEGDLLRFAPGDEVTGTAEIVLDSDVRCKQVYVTLKWQTEGRGDGDEAKIAHVHVFPDGQAALSAGVTVTKEFRFTLPDGPWSYSGRYVAIVWVIEIQLDIPGRSDIVHQQRFVLAPRR